MCCLSGDWLFGVNSRLDLWSCISWWSMLRTSIIGVGGWIFLFPFVWFGSVVNGGVHVIHSDERTVSSCMLFLDNHEFFGMFMFVYFWLKRRVPQCLIQMLLQHSRDLSASQLSWTVFLRHCWEKRYRYYLTYHISATQFMDVFDTTSILLPYFSYFNIQYKISLKLLSKISEITELV